MNQSINHILSFSPRLLALGALMIVLSSCQDAAIKPGEVSLEIDPTLPVESKPLVILTWDEYFSPGIIAEFEKETGIPVEFVTFSNLDEMDGLLRSRPADFDLLVASGGVVADLIELQQLQPIRRDQIPLFKNLDEPFLGLKFDPANEFSVPYMWGTTLIAYRSDKIKEPEKSWKALWSERYRGRVLMVDDGFDVYAASLLACGHEINSQDPAEIEEATKRLEDQVQSLDSRFVDIFEVREKLLSGDCWMSMTYSSDAAVLAEEEENIDYFIPREGAPLWVDSFVIPRESRNSEPAHRFLDFLCRAEVAAENSNELWCASVNREAKAHLSREVLADETLYIAPEVMSRCNPEAQSSPERQRLINQGLKRVFDRVREAEAKPLLSLLIWEEYLPASVAKQFEDAFSARLLITGVGNSEQLQQELASNPGAYDVVVADELTLGGLIKLRLLKELDPSKLDILTGEDAPFLAAPVDQTGRYAAPYLWGLTVLAGRTEALKGAIPSWSLLWREDLRIALLDEPADLLWVALLALGHDPKVATRVQIDEATAKLGARFPNFTDSMMDLISALDALEAGELDLIMTYNGDASLRAATVPGIEVIVPQEGAPLWLDSFAVSRDAPRPDLAYDFIRFMTSPEVSEATALALHYASPLSGVIAKMESGNHQNSALYPGPEILGKCKFVQFNPEMEKAVNQSIIHLIRGSQSRSSVEDTPSLEISSSGVEANQVAN